MRNRSRTVLCLAGAAALTACGLRAGWASAAPDAAAPGPAPRIVNGLASFAHPSVGMLLFGSTPNTASLVCSGTLVGCHTFLTAAHCVEDVPPALLHVFLPSAGMFAVAAVRRHQAYAFPDNDVAVLDLAGTVNGVRPSPINDRAHPSPGTAAEIVGFGTQGDGNVDLGIKRAGRVTTAACGPEYSDERQLCWSFTAPVGPPGADANTCNGDSGGPLFIDDGCSRVVAGITSGGTAAGCLADDFSFDTDVFAYHGFIQEAAGADLAATACGPAPQAGDAGAPVVGFGGTLDGATVDARFVVAVEPGTRLLRVALNAHDDGISDFDLYVEPEVPATPSNADCRRAGASQFAFCEIADPAPGAWHVLIRRFAGAGALQVTATMFADTAPEPAAGAACDDGNPCTTGDRCDGGRCRGVARPDGAPCADAAPCGDRCAAGVCRALQCRRPLGRGTARLAVRAGRRGSAGDDVTWTWTRGAATDRSDLGDPQIDTAYTLEACQRTADGAMHLIATQRVPPGAAWEPTKRGFRYRDTTRAGSALDRLTLEAGAAGKARIGVHGRGAGLALAPLPLASAAPILVQLRNDRTCWEAEFPGGPATARRAFSARGE